MHYQFPPVRWADTNTPYQQLEHIREEHGEAWQAMLKGHLGDVDDEVMDLYHSCETYFRVRERMGIDVDAVLKRTQDKNHDRGHYDADGNG